jgi:very-short-patch-repair endonuclease
MTELYNKASEKVKRQLLRNQMPLAEQIIWERLRGKQVSGCKFRRQYSIDVFVVDFYTPELKLAIEIDGESHTGEQAQAYDAERQMFLESKGTRFLRFTNQQVMENLDQVIEIIERIIVELRTSPTQK